MASLKILNVCGSLSARISFLLAIHRRPASHLTPSCSVLLPVNSENWTGRLHDIGSLRGLVTQLLAKPLSILARYGEKGWSRQTLWSWNLSVGGVNDHAACNGVLGPPLSRKGVATAPVLNREHGHSLWGSAQQEPSDCTPDTRRVIRATSSCEVWPSTRKIRDYRSGSTVSAFCGCGSLSVEYKRNAYLRATISHSHVRHSTVTAMLYWTKHLPVEVCESIIDNVRPRQLFDHQGWLLSSAALSACSLVCRAWRPRAQISLFDVVVLSSPRCLYRLAALLLESPHISTYIYEIRLYGHCIQNSNSVLALFPTVIGSKVLNLRSLALYTTESNEPSRVVTHPDASVDSPTPAHEEIPLPYLPIHPRFSTLLKAISKLTSLRVGVVKFKSLGDFNGKSLDSFRPV
ncbi:hypothetical protein C8Q80DRAFT_433123 [Daedaleopsis nitida]|nr:hypothetical protein C8Q80DRAFT_433123 [Daedaleopsis nitida]